MKILKNLLVIVALAVVAAVGYYFGFDHGFEQAVDTDNNAQTNTQNPPVSNDTFQVDKDGNFFGILTLNGYLKTETRVCNPGDMCGETVEYSSFVFDMASTNNDAIKQFVKGNLGNSYVGEGQIGLGCMQTDRNRIYYENDADSGYVTGTITGDDYFKLRASSKDAPVQLKFTREFYTGGRGAPDCYSHFRNFDVL